MNYYFKLTILILIHLNYFYTNAQLEITGEVLDEKKLPIENANVLIRNKSNTIVAYAFTKENGVYSITLNPNKNSYLLISANSLGFEEKTDTIFLKPFVKKHILNFNLIEKQEKLDEVLIKSTEKIKREGSIITYKVDSFIDGTEETIEEVLKNLPGIEVLKNGTIKAHGKFIDKLLIEGEDMFDKKYALLSKNLDAKVVDKIQIIDDFEDNPIIAKVIKSEKVAINIVLKEEYKNIWFGNASFGLGSENRIKTTTNIGLIRDKIKLFNFNNYNNLGLKASEQVNENSNFTKENSILNQVDKEYKIKPIYAIKIDDNSYFNEGQSTFNKAFISGLSLISTINKTKIRGTGYFTNDILNQLFKSETVFNINNPPIIYSEINNSKVNNLIAGGEFEIKNTIGEKSYLKNTLSFKLNPEKINSLSIFNDSKIEEKLNKKELYLSNNLHYSYLINKKKILHSYVYFGKDKINQNSKINSPLFNTAFNLSNESNIKNKSKDNITFYGIKSMLLFNLNHFKSVIGIEYNSLIENRKNKFILPNNIEIDSLQNNIKFKQQKIAVKTNFEYSITKNIDLISRLNFLILESRVLNLTKSIFIVNPFIKLQSKKLKLGYVSVSYNKTNYEPKSNLFLGNYQLSSYNSFKKGTNSIEYPNNNIFSFYYQIANKKKTKSLSTKFQYIKSDGNYSTNSQISENIYLTSSNYVNNSNLFFFNTDITFYLKKMNLSTNIGTSQNWSNSLIDVNSSNLKTLKMYNATYYVTGRTYFNSPLNFNVKINVNYSSSTFNSIISRTNWENVFFKLIYNLSETWVSNLENNFYFINNTNFSFINFYLDYNPKKSKFSYKFILNNLINENEFSINEIEDYTTYNSTIKLLPRYALIVIRYRF